MGWEVGGRFKRERTRLYWWPTHVHVRQRPTQYCEAIILQLKVNKFTKKKRASTKWWQSCSHSRGCPYLCWEGWIFQGAVATEVFAHMTPNEAEEDCVATAELWTKVSASDAPGRFSIQGPHGIRLVWGPRSGSAGKEPACDAGELGSILESGRSPGEGHGNPLQYSCLENPMDRGVWRVIVHGVSKSQTRLSDWHFHFLSQDLVSVMPTKF